MIFETIKKRFLKKNSCAFCQGLTPRKSPFRFWFDLWKVGQNSLHASECAPRNLPGAKPLARSFAMSRFAGNSAHGKTPGKRSFDKAFCILPGLLPLANYHLSCRVSPYFVFWVLICSLNLIFYRSITAISYLEF